MSRTGWAFALAGTLAAPGHAAEGAAPSTESLCTPPLENQPDQPPMLEAYKGQVSV